MSRFTWLLAATLLLAACGAAGGGSDAGADAPPPDCGVPISNGAGALIDPNAWVTTEEGTEFFGEPALDAECDEELGLEIEDLGIVVLTVVTDFCDYVTVVQPTRRAIARGENVLIRARHGSLAGPDGFDAHFGVAIGDELAWSETVTLGSPIDGATCSLNPDEPLCPQFFSIEWTATKDIPACSPIYFHVDNHGLNNYSIVEIERCPDTGC